MWNEIVLENLLLVPIRNGLTKPSKVRGSGIKMIGMGELFANDRIASTLPMDLVPVTEKELESSAVQKNDLLFARQSLVLEGAGKCSIVTDVLEPTVFESHLIRIRIDEKKADPRFLYYYFQSPQGKGKIRSIVEQVAAAGIRGKDLIKLTVPCPDLITQKRVSFVLECIDKKIENNKAVDNNLVLQSEALFKEFFFPQDSSTDAWEKSSLLGIADYLNGLAMQKYRPSEDEDGLPVLKIRELRQGFFDSNTEFCSPAIKPEYIVNDGDVIFSWSGSLLVDFWCGGTGGLNQHLFKVTSHEYDKWFYFVWTKHHLQRFAAIAAGMATTMGHIKREELKKSEVLIPPHAEYKRIGSLLGPLFDLIIKNRIECRKLALFRDEITAQIMAGNIDTSNVSLQ
jgi:type I restriction enzyme S subunit